MLSTILNMVLIALGLTAFLGIILLGVVIFIVLGAVIFGTVDAITDEFKSK